MQYRIVLYIVMCIHYIISDQSIFSNEKRLIISILYCLGYLAPLDILSHLKFCISCDCFTIFPLKTIFFTVSKWFKIMGKYCWLPDWSTCYEFSFSSVNSIQKGAKRKRARNDGMKIYFLLSFLEVFFLLFVNTCFKHFRFKNHSHKYFFIDGWI